MADKGFYPMCYVSNDSIISKTFNVTWSTTDTERLFTVPNVFSVRISLYLSFYSRILRTRALMTSVECPDFLWFHAGRHNREQKSQPDITLPISYKYPIMYIHEKGKSH